MKWSLAGLGLLCLLASEARAGTRYALVVGVNQGEPHEVHLRFAERDAHRVASILTTLGGFDPERVITLAGADAGDVRQALDNLEANIRQDEEALLFVYYSGHADGQALHLRGTRFDLTELRDRVVSSEAAARVLVLDACRSGVLTRVKGGRRGPVFPVETTPPLSAQGVAILASSAAGEDSQESDELGASFFTHYFVSAMLGAADRNGDGEVTLGESFEYAAERTLAATNVTIAGPQHPTYKLELKGRNELVLTDLRTARSGIGVLEFTEAGRYLVEDPNEGKAVAEVSLESGARPLSLQAGEYKVTRRGRDHLLQGEFRVRQGEATTVSTEQMGRVDFARVVRKGGTSLTAVASAFATGGVQASINRLGTTWKTGVGARFDLADLSLEARFGVGGANTENERNDSDNLVLTLSVAGMRAFDLGPVTLNVGLELGGLMHDQRNRSSLVPDPHRVSYGLFGGPIILAELPIDRFYLRAESALPTYYVLVGDTKETEERVALVTFRAGVGAGVHF